MVNFLVKEALINGYDCAGTKFFPLFQATKFLIVLIQISVPFALVIWGSLDYFKALIARDEKEMRIKRKPFVQRVVAAMIVLVLPWLIQLLSRYMAGKDNTSNFWKCYNQAKAKLDFSEWQNGSKKTTYNADRCVDHKSVSPAICASYGCMATDCKGTLCNCAPKPTSCSQITAPVVSAEEAGKLCNTYKCDVDKYDQDTKSWSCKDKVKITQKACGDYNYKQCTVAQNGDACEIKKITTKKKNKKGKTVKSTTYICAKQNNPKQCSDYAASECPKEDSYHMSCSVHKKDVGYTKEICDRDFYYNEQRSEAYKQCSDYEGSDCPPKDSYDLACERYIKVPISENNSTPIYGCQRK